MIRFIIRHFLRIFGIDLPSKNQSSIMLTKDGKYVLLTPVGNKYSVQVFDCLADAQQIAAHLKRHDKL